MTAVDVRRLDVTQRLATLRREQARGSLLMFARTYLPEHARLPPSPMHEEIARLLETASVERRLRLAVAAPRGHAKSTLVSLVYVLWSLCYNRERFIVLISDTAEQAEDLLHQVKHELESNERLRDDFPEVCERRGEPPAPARWRRRDIETRDGARVTALGAGQRIRGRRSRAERPTLIIVDDIESDELVRSPERRDERWDWLMGAVLKSGAAATNAVVVGTVLHQDSVLARLLDPVRSPAWTRRRYQAIIRWADRADLWDQFESVYAGRDTHEGAAGPEAADAFYHAHEHDMLAGTEVLWPQLEDYYALARQRLGEGRDAFAAEKQNDPAAGDDGLFRPDDLVFWDGPNGFANEEALRSSLDGYVTLEGAVDPSLGIPGRSGDDCAIVSLIRHARSGVLYVVDADIRRRTPNETIDAILAFHRRRNYGGFAVEAVQFQQFFRSELDRRAAQAGRALRTYPARHTSDKITRIRWLQPLLASGQVRLSRRHATLIDQLLRFPRGRHDDGPDALEMAVRLAMRPRARFVEGDLA